MEKKKENKRDEPLPPGLKVISLIFYAGSLALFLLSLFLLASAAAINNLPPYFPELKPLKTNMLLFFGLIFLPFAFIYRSIGRGIAQGKKSAQISAIAFAGVSLIVIIYSMMKGYVSQNLPGLFIVSLLLLYLLLSPGTKRFLKKE